MQLSLHFCEVDCPYEIVHKTVPAARIKAIVRRQGNLVSFHSSITARTLKSTSLARMALQSVSRNNWAPPMQAPVGPKPQWRTVDHNLHYIMIVHCQLPRAIIEKAGL